MLYQLKQDTCQVISDVAGAYSAHYQRLGQYILVHLRSIKKKGKHLFHYYADSRFSLLIKVHAIAVEAFHVNNTIVRPASPRASSLTSDLRSLPLAAFSLLSFLLLRRGAICFNRDAIVPCFGHPRTRWSKLREKQVPMAQNIKGKQRQRFWSSAHPKTARKNQVFTTVTTMKNKSTERAHYEIHNVYLCYSAYWKNSVNALHKPTSTLLGVPHPAIFFPSTFYEWFVFVLWSSCQ